MRVSRSYRAILALSTTLALAQFGAPEPVCAQESADEGRDRERALVLFEAAELRYQEARFVEAVELLVEARDLYDEAVISYNLGRAYEELGRSAEAAQAFRHYLERAPDAQDRRLVEARIERLDAEATSTDTDTDTTTDTNTDTTTDTDTDSDSDTTTDSDSDADTNTAPSPSRGPNAAALVVSGVGLATLGGAFAFGAVSNSSRQNAIDDPVHETSRQSFRDAETFATVANVMFVVGGAITAIGLTWLVLDLALGGGDDDDLALRIGPGSIAIRGTL